MNELESEMFFDTQTITNAGAAVLAAHKAANTKMQISKVVFGSTVANAIAGQRYPSDPRTSSLAAEAYVFTADKVEVGTNLPRSKASVGCKVIVGSAQAVVSHVAVYSGNTLVALCSGSASLINPTLADVLIGAVLPVEPAILEPSNGVYRELASPTAVLQTLGVLNDYLNKNLPTGSKGVSYFGQAGQAVTRKLLTAVPVCESTVEANAEKTRGSNSDIFNNWYRFSHNTANWNQPSNSSELTAWMYDSAADAIKCTLNTATYVGFVSDKTYDKYELDVDLSASGDTDDDDIAVVMAFYKDPDTGREHTLSAIRSPGGTGFSFAVVRNYKLPDQEFLHRSTVIAYGNGGYGATAAQAGYVANTAGQNWKSMGKTRLKVTRDGTRFTVVTSEFGANWQTFKQSSAFTVDVANVPSCAMFTGKCAYGFAAHSQFSSTFYVRSMVDETATIIDIQANTTWSKIASKWTATAYASRQEMTLAVGPGRMLHNPVTGKTFYVLSNDILRIF